MDRMDPDQSQSAVYETDGAPLLTTSGAGVAPALVCTPSPAKPGIPIDEMRPDDYRRCIDAWWDSRRR
jgi:hypothetical protein